MTVIKNEVLYRVYAVLFGILVVAVGIMSKVVRIQVVEGEEWRRRDTLQSVALRPVEAERGNIFSDDGSLLATSIPLFDIRFDTKAMDEELFHANIDSLSYCLATFVDNSYTVGGYKFRLQEAREKGDRYFLIKKDATFEDLDRIQSFPLLNLGQYRGGLIVEKHPKRERPFGLLAHRTIGYIREGAKPIGLEGAYDHALAGDRGQRLMRKLSKDVYIPVHDLTAIEPRNGDDVVTTLDMSIQDITEEALMRAMNHHNAEWGTAIVLEVKTGAVKAMANLGKVDDGWWENYNYAVGSAIEPGSTFKLASMMALLEDGYVDLADTIQLEGGRSQFYEEYMEDAVLHGLDSTSVRRAFEVSSNVGVAKLVQQYYGNTKKAGQFIQRLKTFRLNLPTGIEIEGEADPYIKEAYSADDQWSGTTLPWMSIGYELRLTPLQILTFFNAVANDGQMMKPYLVKAVQRFGEPMENYPPVVLKRKIASKSTLEKARELLEGVVERGTAAKLQSDQYRFAGKTGTAQVNYKRMRQRHEVGGYQASFVGYFPAENPVYSCIVVINNPKTAGIYGSEVAGPVFREIADKCYATRVELQMPLNAGKAPAPVAAALPKTNVGFASDIANVMDYLRLPLQGVPSTEWVVAKADSSFIGLQDRTLAAKGVPNVVGMGLRDALYAMENRGLKVEIEGVGKVYQQSLKPGTNNKKGQSIKLWLD